MAVGEVAFVADDDLFVAGQAAENLHDAAVVVAGFHASAARDAVGLSAAGFINGFALKPHLAIRWKAKDFVVVKKSFRKVLAPDSQFRLAQRIRDRPQNTVQVSEMGIPVCCDISSQQRRTFPMVWQS